MTRRLMQAKTADDTILQGVMVFMVFYIASVSFGAMAYLIPYLR